VSLDVNLDWTGIDLSGGRYRVTAKLGEGGMGFVFRAHDGKLQADVVIKVPRRTLMADDEFAQRFSREIRSLVRLSHPHIVKITDVDEHDGLPFAVMQFLSGGSLDDRLRTDREKPIQGKLAGVLEWLPHIAGALDFVGTRGYVHRDVKPGNILFDEPGNAYLSDFGIAKVLATDQADSKQGFTRAGMVLGTPEYMAPELIMGKPIDGKTDQYALAVTVFQCLADRHPIEGSTANGIYVAQVTQEPDVLHALVPTIPAAVSTAVKRALSKHPNDRFPSCVSFADAFSKAVREPAHLPRAEREPYPLPRSPVAAQPARAVGIDLGTTYSVIACLDPQGRPTSIPNADGDLLTPSVVLFDDGGTVVGKQAVLAAAIEPEKVADCVKRDMGSKHYHKKINGEPLPPEVISSYILRRLKADAQRKLGAVDKAVITVPAYFDETRRRATMDAGRLAGLEVLDILNEPTAAAIAYGYQEGFLDRSGRVKGDKPLRALVYDLGGGTFDVTVVEMRDQSFKALATDGDVRLGGKDWDEKLVEIAAERLQKELGEDPRQCPETLEDMWLAAESAKRTLSERLKATMFVNHAGRRLKVEITRQEFEEATAPLVLRTGTTADIVVMQAGLTWPDIDRVLVVGGATRMPMIRRMLEKLAGRAVDYSVSVDEAVAHGAALYADVMLQQQGCGGGHAQFAVTNINSHSLGIVGIDAQSGERVNRVIIAKNTPLPHSAAQRFQTFKAGQTTVKVAVVEGESEIPDACMEVGTCVIRGLPPNLPAGWPVEVRYSYQENGRLQVSATLVGHEAKVKAEFVRDNSLSEDDLMLWGESLTAEAMRNGE